MHLGINKAKEELAIATTPNTSKKKTSIRGLKRERPEKVILPRRASQRIRRVDPDGTPLPALPPPAPEPVYERKPSGPLKAKDNIYNASSETDGNNYIAHLKSVMRSDYKLRIPNEPTKTSDSYVNKLTIKLTEDRVAKVVPTRVMAVALHPGNDTMLSVCGDKWGRIGLWDVESHHGDGGVCCFEPHNKPVCHLEFHPENVSRLFSSSYDGTVRCLDIHKEVFDEIYSTPEDDDNRVSGFSFTSADTLVTAQGDGYIGFIDCRTPGTGAEHEYHGHAKNIKNIHVHPIYKHYIATAGADAVVHVWDARKMTKKDPQPIESLSHGKSVDSAFFSPITGNQLLTTSIDDRIRIFDTTVISDDIKTRCTIRHDNYTGRWLSNFKAIWHPRREDLFIVGSMSRPRQIEMYNSGGNLIKCFRDENLASVCSLNAFHPTRDALLGANSSGKLHLFM